MSGGFACLDYDGDGLVDIYFVNGAPLPGAKSDKPPTNVLYKNLGGFQFGDVTQQAGVGDTGYGMGATVGDYDNDGCPDIYVSNFGPKVLYRNHGDGAFSDVTSRAGVAGGNKVGAGVCFLDADGDGDLDLLVANYVQFSFEKHVPYVFRGRLSYPSPIAFEPEPLALYRNLGDGTFQDTSAESGVGRYAGRGMGTIAADYDGDGHTDIFVANDLQENFLLRNDGTGTFEEDALAAGTAYDTMGRPRANMGVDCGDFDNDGRLDFYVTAYEGQSGALFRQVDRGLFQDVSDVTGAGQRTAMQVTWGCGLVDFDNDGRRDIFVVCGHTEDNIESRDNATTYAARPILLRQTDSGKFEDVTDSCGDGMKVRLVGRGAVFEDLDNDGDIDVVILGLRGKPAVLKNALYESGSKNHWLQIVLRGTKTNRDGVGARVKVVAGNLTQIDEVHSGRGYQSHWGSRLHFGLGQHDRVDRIEVRWIGGGLDVVENVRANQRLTITEAADDELPLGSEDSSKRPDDVSLPPAFSPNATPDDWKRETRRMAARLAADLPDQLDALHASATILWALGDQIEAARLWEKCLAVDGQFPPAYEGLGRVSQSQGDFERAIAMFRKAIALDPRNRRLTMFLADSLMRANRMKEAVAELTDFLRSGPAPPAAVVHLGQAYLALEQYDAARRVLETAIEQVPEERQVHFGLAKAYERLGQPDKAQRHRDKVQQLAAVHREAGKGRVRAAGPPTAVHKDTVRAHLDAAGVYSRYGNLKEAESLWRKAAALDPKDIECRQALAALYDRSARTTEAVRIREQLRDLAPASAKAQKKDE